MRASIYRLRASGVPLPQPETPVVGDFRLVRERRGDKTVKVARLLGDGKLDSLPSLMNAEVTVVSEFGMVVHGLEPYSRGSHKSRVHWGPQTWWVFILTEHAIERFESENPLEAMLDEQRSIATRGIRARSGRS